MGDGLSELFEDTEFGHTNFTGAASPEDLFSILESLEDATKEVPPFNPFDEPVLSPRGGDHDSTTRLVSQGSASSSIRPREIDEGDVETNHARKKLKSSTLVASVDAAAQDGQHKMSHITVERNRRKQMNEHLSVLRSLMPCFYVKRGDQASIIGGVVDYIKELQQVLQSLEAKKQRKVYSEVLSPRPVSSPRTTPLSPRPPPLSPRMGLPISPRTPQPGSPYKPRMPQSYRSPTLVPSHESSPSIENNVSELAANSKSPVADVEVKFSGPNVLLKTASHRIPGQALKIITALEGLSLEILHVSISTIDDTMLNSFTIKIGIECELSAEELAQEILQTFS
ncbi:transcription factor SPEECHLESS [Cocos nucifera]|nr:transcription factor SPEECHLESS [Cocos nucifera]